MSLEILFCPSSIAVIGASSDEQRERTGWIGRLQQFGYPGKLYPINPRASQILGCHAYPNIKDISAPVDYAIPINDDAVRSIKLVVSCLADSVIEGRQLGEKKKPPKGRSRPKDDGRKKTTKKKSQRTTIDKTKKTKKTKKKAKEKSKKGD